MQDRSSPTRVLWLAKGLGPGGMERLLVNHAIAGDRERFTYEAAYMVDRPNSVIGELESHGVVCHKLGTGGRFDVSWVTGLRRLLRDRRIDVVHVHSPLPAAVARVVARTLPHRPRVVYTEHNSWTCYSWPTRIANAVTYPLDDAQIAVSEAARQSAVAPLRSRVEVLTHGIDLSGARGHRDERAAVRAELGVDDTTVVAITIANLRTEKAYDVLLDAAAIALEQEPRLLFLGVGHGPLQAELGARHAELGLGDRFRFLGFRSDAQRLLAGSDIFVLSSREEGLPVSLMEAMAVGLPVVATAVGGIPDYVRSGVDGVLVEPEHADRLAAAIVSVAGDDARRKEMGVAAETVADAFDARVAVARIDDIYDGVRA
ncbi:MAG: glycosyltransferase family 4 protein [Acidimicrobiales bacterium]